MTLHLRLTLAALLIGAMALLSAGIAGAGERPEQSPVDLPTWRLTLDPVARYVAIQPTVKLQPKGRVSWGLF